MNYSHYVLPWVENSSGNGVGEYPNITFTEPSNNLNILNGYVDIYMRNLYKENSRAKKIRLSNNNFSMEYSFKDEAYFANIELPQDTTSLKLEILEVYEGEKFNDLAISAIFIHNKMINKVEKSFIDNIFKK